MACHRQQQTRRPALCIHFPSHLFSFFTFSLKRHWPQRPKLRSTHTTLMYLGPPALLTNWLWFALSNSATLPSAFWVLCRLTRTVKCVSLSPFHSFDHLTIWWISARLRQGLRHGRIRYKLSLLQGTASHHGSFSCLHLSFLTLLFFFFFSSALLLISGIYFFISTKKHPWHLLIPTCKKEFVVLCR